MKFNYQLLARLQMDCEYYLDNRSPKHLWAGNVADQIAKMKELYNILIPHGEIEWIKWEDIIDFERKMS